MQNKSIPALDSVCTAYMYCFKTSSLRRRLIYTFIGPFADADVLGGRSSSTMGKNTRLLHCEICIYLSQRIVTASISMLLPTHYPVKENKA